MSLNQDATIHQGEWVVINDTVYTDATKTERKNLVSSSIEYRLGKIAKDSLVLRLTGTPNAAGSFASVLDAANGRIQITLKPTDTAALSARRYQQQVLVIDSAGKPNVVTDGHLTVEETLPSA